MYRIQDTGKPIDGGGGRKLITQKDQYKIKVCIGWESCLLTKPQCRLIVIQLVLTQHLLHYPSNPQRFLTQK